MSGTPITRRGHLRRPLVIVVGVLALSGLLVSLAAAAAPRDGLHAAGGTGVGGPPDAPALAGAVQLAADTATADGVVRVGGATRWETAADIVSSLHGDYDTAFVASGMDYPDALSAGPVAAGDDAPLMLTPSDRALPEVRRLVGEADEAIVVGGEAAIDAAVTAALADDVASVERVSGRSRWQTSAQLAREAFPDGADVAYVAAGDGPFADALTGGAAAATEDAPMLLVAHDHVPADVEDALRRLAPEEIVVVGGEAAIAADVERELRDIASVERIAGADRFDTSARLIDARFDAGAVDAVFVATGHDFADALAGVPAAARAGAPLVLASREEVPAAVRTATQQLDVSGAVLLGGTQALGSQVERTFEQIVDGEVDGDRDGDGYVYESPVAGVVSIPPGYPTPRTTGLAGVGVDPDDLPVYDGPTRITDARTIEGERIEEPIVVDGGDVTIRRSHVEADTTHVVLLTQGGGTLTIEDSTVRALNGEAHVLRGTDITVRRSDLRQGTTVAQVGNRSHIEDSFIADAGIPTHSDGHHDGVQILNARDGATLRNNTVLGSYEDQNSAMHLQGHSSWSGLHDVVVEGNFLSGGNYTMYLEAHDDQDDVTGAVVRDNLWNAGSWRYGPAKRENVADDLVWERNRTTAGDDVD